MAEWTLRNTLKEQRARAGLTQEALANLVGVTRKTINTIERAVYVPSTTLALRIARSLDVDINSIFILEEVTRKRG